MCDEEEAKAGQRSSDRLWESCYSLCAACCHPVPSRRVICGIIQLMRHYTPDLSALSKNADCIDTTIVDADKRVMFMLKSQMPAGGALLKTSPMCQGSDRPVQMLPRELPFADHMRCTEQPVLRYPRMCVGIVLLGRLETANCWPSCDIRRMQPHDRLRRCSTIQSKTSTAPC